MAKELHTYSTDDIDLASAIHAWGGKLIDIDQQNPKAQVFVFELTDEKSAKIPTFYDGTGDVKALAICNSRGVLFRLLRKQAVDI
jgi:hypothetical protein